MNFNPINGYILVERIKTASFNSNILIPDSAKEKPSEGIVVKSGKGKTLDTGQFVPISVKPGDKILFEEFSDYPFSINGIDHAIIHEDSVIGVLE